MTHYGFSLMDMLLALLFIGAVVSGARRGFFREALLLLLWVPLAVVAVYVIATTYNPELGGQVGAHAMQVLMAMGLIFVMAMGIVWFIDRKLLRPALANMDDPTLKVVNGFLGSFVGAGRIVVGLVIGLLIYDLYAGDPTQTARTENSAIVAAAYTESKDLRSWLEASGYIKRPRVIYDRKREQKSQDLDSALQNLPESQRKMLRNILKNHQPN